MTADRFKEEQLDAAASAVAQLKAGNEGATAELAVCDREVPPLK